MPNSNLENVMFNVNVDDTTSQQNLDEAAKPHELLERKERKAPAEEKSKSKKGKG